MKVDSKIFNSNIFLTIPDYFLGIAVWQHRRCCFIRYCYVCQQRFDSQLVLCCEDWFGYEGVLEECVPAGSSYDWCLPSWPVGVECAAA